MGCPSEVEIGDNLIFSVTTHNASTQVATDADSVPTYRVYEDETGTAILTGSMAKLDDANTTGFYTESIACTSGNGFDNGKTYTIYIEATVDSSQGAISYGFKAYDYRKSDLTAIATDEQSATDLKDFADTGYDPSTHKVAGVVLVDGLTANNDKTGYSLTPTTGLGNQTADITGSLSGSVGSVTGAVGSVAGSVGGNVTGSVGSVLGGINTSAGTITTLDGLDTAQDTQHSTTQSAISGLNDLSTSDIDARLAAYDGPTNTEMVAAFTEIKGGTWSSSTDTLEAIRDRGDSAWITATGFSTLDAAGIRTAVGMATANLDTQLGNIVTDTGTTIPGFLATIIGDTNELQTEWANGGRLDVLIDGIKAVTDAIPDSGAMSSIAQESTVAGLSFSTFDPSSDEIESGVTYLQGLRAACAALAGILSGANGSTITIKAIGAAADGTTRITATVDADGNRSAVTLNL